MKTPHSNSRPTTSSAAPLPPRAANSVGLLAVPAVILALLVPGAPAVAASDGVTDRADGVHWIDAAATAPDDYQLITGFEVSYELVAAGSIGGSFPLNAVTFSSGAHEAGDFAMDYSGAFPQYAGTAPELLTHATGENAYLGEIFFAKGRNAGALAVGEVTTATYEGDKALFSEADSVLSVFGHFGTGVEIIDVEWVYGEITPGEDPTWEPVPSTDFRDIATVDDPNPFNYIDITVPDAEGTYPVVFWIHGGGWQYFDKSAVIIADTKEYLLSRGYAFVSADYTLSRTEGDTIVGGYPQMIEDLKAAVRFLRAHGDEYRLDTSFIGAMGESAGGHLAMLLGTTNGSAAHEDLSMGNADFSSDVEAMVSYFGPSDLVDNIMGLAVTGTAGTTEMQTLGSPYHQLTADDVPLFLTHGENDATVPVWHSKVMDEKAVAVLGDENVTSVYFENAPHGSRAAFDIPLLMTAVGDFLDDAREKAARPPYEPSATYGEGDLVTYEGKVFQAQWWVSGQTPGASPYGAWAEIGEAIETSDGTVLAWTNSWIYTGGEIVVHDDRRWKAKWWTRNQEPGDPRGPWEDLGGIG
ncbi:acetyl esterase/lipase [Microbacterium terrae]|nr:carbohydrate-binding protein [Microbacterium terrae]MBP1076324.1 acetyl esterase/lipase [Microbacterium terrae]